MSTTTQVNAYNAANRTTAGAQGTKKKGSDALDMNDFMKLLATQLSNQDAMNPMDNTAFIAQMAQFTSLQAMQTMSEITYASYGASMIGKNVLVGTTDDRGKYVEDKGMISAIKFAGGDCIVTVNGKDYTLSAVMEILDKLPDPPADDNDDDDGDGGGTSKTAGTTEAGNAGANSGSVLSGTTEVSSKPLNAANTIPPASISAEASSTVVNNADAENSFGNKSPLETEPSAQELFPVRPILFDPTV